MCHCRLGIRRECCAENCSVVVDAVAADVVTDGELLATNYDCHHSVSRCPANDGVGDRAGAYRREANCMSPVHCQHHLLTVGVAVGVAAVVCLSICLTSLSFALSYHNSWVNILMRPAHAGS